MTEKVLKNPEYRVFRYSDIWGLVPYESKDRKLTGSTILAFGGILRRPEMPDEIAELIASWGTIAQSPSGTSIYNTLHKTWGFTPEGSLRASNHWNFQDGYGNGPHCPTHSVIAYPRSEPWSIGVFHTGKYTICGTVQSNRKLVRKSIKEAQSVLMTQSQFSAIPIMHAPGGGRSAYPIKTLQTQ